MQIIFSNCKELIQKKYLHRQYLIVAIFAIFISHCIINWTDLLKNDDLFKNETSVWLYESVIESYTEPIHLKSWFV